MNGFLIENLKGAKMFVLAGIELNQEVSWKQPRDSSIWRNFAIEFPLSFRKEPDLYWLILGLSQKYLKLEEVALRLILGVSTWIFVSKVSWI